jgi:hypothetical protein
MTLLPYQVGDVVVWRGEPGVVVEVRGDRVVVRTEDDVLRITTVEVLRGHQPPARGAA